MLEAQAERTLQKSVTAVGRPTPVKHVTQRELVPTTLPTVTRSGPASARYEPQIPKDFERSAGGHTGDTSTRNASAHEPTPAAIAAEQIILAPSSATGSVIPKSSPHTSRRNVLRPEARSGCQASVRSAVARKPYASMVIISTIGGRSTLSSHVTAITSICITSGRSS